MNNKYTYLLALKMANVISEHCDTKTDIEELLCLVKQVHNIQFPELSD
jgi:hypothetical protein